MHHLKRFGNTDRCKNSFLSHGLRKTQKQSGVASWRSGDTGPGVIGGAPLRVFGERGEYAGAAACAGDMRLGGRRVRVRVQRVFRGGQQNCHVCVSSHRVRQEVIRAPERSRRSGVFCVPQFLVP